MKFAFIIHPIDLEDITKRIKPFKLLPGAMAEAVFRHFPVLKVSEITGVRSPYGETEGWFILCPLTSRQMLELPVDYVTGRIIEAGKLAERLGADIVGLGAITKVVGDAGITIAKNLDIAVTSGNSYTRVRRPGGARQAAEFMGSTWDGPRWRWWGRRALSVASAPGCWRRRRWSDPGCQGAPAPGTGRPPDSERYRGCPPADDGHPGCPERGRRGDYRDFGGGYSD